MSCAEVAPVDSREAVTAAMVGEQLIYHGSMSHFRGALVAEVRWCDCGTFDRDPCDGLEIAVLQAGGRHHLQHVHASSLRIERWT